MTAREPDRLADLPTPSLVLDETRLDRNIATMAAFAAERGLALRPHVKTHKSVEIARRQVAAGAAGITVATISEAEIFAAAGFTDIFIAYPLWLDADKTARLRRLLEAHQHGADPLLIGVDSIEGAERAAQAAAGLLHRLAVLVEVDSGHHRSGVEADQAGTVAAAAVSVGLDVAGVFTFPGHSYSPEGRRSAAGDEGRELASAVAALAAAGVTARIVSGGSTPSAEFADAGVLTELRPGVYVFRDAQQWELGMSGPDDIALTVHATVVSQRRDHLITDAGSKVLGVDRGSFSTGFGRLLDHPDARITALSEHHATITQVDLPAGSRITVVPNHVCIAVNLADEYTVVRDGAVIGRWPVDARGANT
ncbi:alanine racemase [Cryobacterium sp. SO2]|uniref:alanine racemase n=1 Tax=Cryobacterium sp. SO2 TaxID=1897060 RepID=UPI00223D9833|nr:alanine racemase [Cryobacterium sp. SO2]WEO77149.1 alanine racemase [Cryobacterium sp. SO2]